MLNGQRWVDLPPASAAIRRMQHDMARQAQLVSHSYGKEPNRRVAILPGIMSLCLSPSKVPKAAEKPPRSRPGGISAPAGYTVLTTREPGGTPIGDQVREVLTSMRQHGHEPRTETLLFCAARAQLVEEVIRPRTGSAVKSC